MANPADQTAEAKAAAAAEKAFAAAADSSAASQTAIAAASTAQAKIDAAVAEVKAAPKGRKVPAKRERAAKKAAAPKTVRATAPAREALKNKTTAFSNLKDKIMDNTQTQDFAAGVKNAAADAQTRAKAAYDKFQTYAGEMTEMTKGNIEALVEAGKILGQGMQDIARSEVEAAKGAFETVTADLKAMAAVKSPTELFKLQGEIARRNFDAAVARASKNAEVSVKLANDAFAPISNRMSLAAERLSNAA